MITTAANSETDSSFTDVAPELVRAAMLAPSPDNNQPWLFAVRENRLLICADARYALPSDVDDMFQFLAIGAATENACIAARHLGYDPEVRLRSASESERDANIAGQVVEISLRKGSTPDPLYGQLQPRCTSRKVFSTRPIEPATLEGLSDSIAGFSGVQLNWVSDRKGIGSLARVVAQGDLIRLQHRPFHAELYKQLRFTVEETERTRDGLDLRTLELPPGTGAVLRWLRSWSRMKLIHTIGVGKLFALPSLMTIRRSGALGILTVPDRTNESFLTCGRAMERLWLSVTQRGLSLQPLGSLPIFFGHLLRGAGSGLSAQHLARLSKLRERFADLHPSLANRALVMLVRVGLATTPKVRSLRRNADDVLLKPGRAN